jgi:kumamolisin
VASEERVALPGSEPPRPIREVVGDDEPSTPLEVTVLLRPRQSLEHIDTQAVMSREEFAASYGADPDDLARVEAFARSHGLQVVEASQARRSIVLRGTTGALGDAFGVQLHRYRDASGKTFRAAAGPIFVPPELAGVVQGVFGFDDRPAALRG